MYCRATEKLVDLRDCYACWNNILDGNGGGWHAFCRQKNLHETATILERIWETDQQTILRLAALNLLSEATITEILGIHLSEAEGPGPYERMMAHDSYKRVRGALRQVMWG